MTVVAPGTLLAVALNLATLLVLAALVLAFVRVAIGPSLPDRVVALDLVTVLMVAFGALYAIRSGEPAFLDIGITLALVGFLATVALARYAEARSRAPDGLERAPASDRGDP